MTTYREIYEDMLDEVGLDGIEGVRNLPASYILKEIDPIAYRCGFLEYFDGHNEFRCTVCGNEFVPYDIEENDEVICPDCLQQE